MLIGVLCLCVKLNVADGCSCCSNFATGKAIEVH